MHIIYLDDSGDDKYWVISALALPIGKWHECLATLKSFRRTLRETYGIPIHKELHAWKFVSGRGDISAKIITRTERSLIFGQLQKTTATLPGARLFNAIAPRSREKDTLGWLLNRINRTLTAWDSYGILVCDEGHEIEYTRLIRKMYIYNPIPSRFGNWMDSGQNWKNLPLSRIVEDPFYKNSAQSFFVQIVDFAAYALLRRENQILSKNRYGVHQMFDILDPILVRESSTYDPQGIIRLPQKE